MQAKSFTLDGKRYPLDPMVPANDISWLVNRLHVSTSDDEITADIQKRVGNNPGWDEKRILQAQRYALKCHRDNQKLYIQVMRG